MPSRLAVATPLSPLRASTPVEQPISRFGRVLSLRASDRCGLGV
jgi:hypothetical protein